ncbi:MAG: P1 family peptidase [Candidatus Acidiferrales bacterium]|jgi:L-aminopeptidase/D-esterase-like protein
MKTKLAGLMVVSFLASTASLAQSTPPPNDAKPDSVVRARDLGIPFTGTPGRFNAITDVAGVQVGYTTLIEGSGKLEVGKGPVRTGVTAVFPRGRDNSDSVFAGTWDLNGNGEMTGIHWVTESGFLDGPFMITNTHSVGVVRDAVIEWQIRTKHQPVTDTYGPFFFSLPVVAETADVLLNDMNGFHVTKADAWHALDSARSGPVEEGNVGGGPGMVCHGWKGGTGTASRVLPKNQGGYTVGVLVQANHGSPNRLTIAGVPVGETLKPHLDFSKWMPEGSGSIIVLIATDAPLLPTQLTRLAKRAALGVGRVGGLGEDSSGDLFLAFSTANPHASSAKPVASLVMLNDDEINPLFEAVVDATEEAIVNTLIAAKTMTGANDFTVPAIPHDQLVEILKAHGRILDAKP